MSNDLTAKGQTTRRQGILPVAYELVPFARSALPPEHKIVAERHTDKGYIEWLIEGPLMPASDKPGMVEAIFTRNTDGMTGHFSHRPNDTWNI